jgi:hypothetical protein
MAAIVEREGNGGGGWSGVDVRRQGSLFKKQKALKRKICYRI